MATVNFYYRSKKEHSHLTVRLLYRHMDVDYVLSGKTQSLIEKSYWKNVHFKKRITDQNEFDQHSKANAELKKLRSHILKSFFQENIPVNGLAKSWLERKINEYYNPEPKRKKLVYLSEHFKYFLKTKENDYSPRTTKNYNTFLKMLEKYETYNDIKLQPKDINLDFKLNFETWAKKNDYSHNTIARGLRTFKTVCTMAKYQGYEISNELDIIRPSYKKSKPIYLTPQDIDKLKKVELTPKLNNARDWLIISCFIGQRVSDLLMLTSRNLAVVENRKVIEITQKKTKKNVSIPIHPEVMEILKKRDMDFPLRLSQQKYNSYIKDVAELAKIDDPIEGELRTNTEKEPEIYKMRYGIYPKHKFVSSHIGRRSFATNFYGQIPTTFLKQITGHSTEKMLLEYIGKSSKDMVVEIFKYF